MLNSHIIEYPKFKVLVIIAELSPFNYSLAINKSIIESYPLHGTPASPKLSADHATATQTTLINYYDVVTLFNSFY